MAGFNYVIVLTVLLCVSFVKTNDLRSGFAQPSARRIFNEIREANPALWKRTDEITVTTSGNELITAVYVTDLRDEKDGEAFIQSGGVGSKSVTIGLKSPTILRGYKFLIEVFVMDPTARYYSKGGENENAAYYDNTQYARKN